MPSKAWRSSGSRGRVGGDDLVAFHDFAQFPARHDIGDASVFLDAGDFDFGDQFPGAINEKFTVFENALVLSDVQHYEIPLGIRHEDIAFQAGGQGDDVLRIAVDGEVVLEFHDLLAQNDIFLLHGGETILSGLQSASERQDLFRGETGGAIGGQFLLGGVAFVLGLL